MDGSDKLHLLMAEAWEKGISPYEFRKCLTSDLEFIDKYNICLKSKRKEIQEEVAHKNKIEEIRRSML